MTPYFSDEHLTILEGDAAAVLATLEPESVHCVVTSPPYWGLRDYGIPPVVWGGEPEHKHAWVERVERVERSKSVHWQHTEGGGTRADGSFRNRHANNGRDADEDREFAATALGSCFCGAWSGSLGLEPTPELYIEHVVSLFREVRRVLRKDGTLWLNLGDSYASHDPGDRRDGQFLNPNGVQNDKGRRAGPAVRNRAGIYRTGILKAKDRVMIPARVALALQADGWWLRDEIVWHKPNPMPSSVGDRTTPAHEMVYLLTKAARYAYDAAAIAEPSVGSDDTQNRFGPRIAVGYPGQPDRKRNGRRQKVPGGWDIAPGAHDTIHRNGRTTATYREATLPGSVSPSTERQRVGLNGRWDASEEDGTAPLTRNKRSVWTVATEPYPDAHFATFPRRLIEPMILAGCPEGGVVLDPFAGTGTVGLVAQNLGRRALLIDLNAEYLRQCLGRNRQVPLGLGA